MDTIDLTERPHFVYTYHLQFFKDKCLEPQACRLFKSFEDAKSGAQTLLDSYTCTADDAEYTIWITKAFCIWDSESKHVTLLESAYQLNCDMHPSMTIPDAARGYYLGQQKAPMLILSSKTDKSTTLMTR